MTPEVDALKGGGGTIAFEGGHGKLLKSGEKNEDETPDRKTGGGSWIPKQTFVLPQVSKLPTAPLQKETARTHEDGDNERGQCVCKWCKCSCRGGNPSRR